MHCELISSLFDRYVLHCIFTSWQIETIVVLPKVEKSKWTQPVVEMNQYDVTFK